MTAAVQSVIVFVVVAIAACYAVLRFMPATSRRTLAAWAARMAKRSGLSDASARRVEAKLSTGGTCGSCDSCKACATPSTESPASNGSAPEAGAYRRISIRRAP